MDSPAELLFRNMQPSKDLALVVKEREEKLEHLYQHIISCRVTIGQQNKTHRTGNVLQVHIDIQVPGHTIMVNHNPSEGDATAVIHKAFDAAAQQLKEYKARKMGHVKQHGTEIAPPE
jgi:ribosome-associated translation inhibitor RaiA